MALINLLHECWHRVTLSRRIFLGAAILGATSLLLVAPWIGLGLLRLLFRTFLLLFGFVVGVFLFACRGQRRTRFTSPKSSTITEVLRKQKSSGLQTTVAKQTVLSRSLDRALQEVLENLFRDYVLTWYKKVAEDEEGFKAIVMDEAWVVVERLAQRLRAVDMVKFLTEDVVIKLTLHFQELRNSRHLETRAAGCLSTAFVMHPCVENHEREVEFLRAVSEVLVCTLLPETDAQCNAMKVLLREVLAFQVLQAGIEELCDPDYINQTLLSYLEYKECVTEQTRASYAYAATYDAFIKIIKECSEIDQLQGIRYHIIAEIMQATVIQNLKEAKGIGAEERDAVIGHVKGEVLMNRNLKRYINQCKFAQNLCEKRIHALGGPDYESSATAEPQKLPRNIKKTSFAELMSDQLPLGFLIQFMNQEGSSAPLRLWIAIEEIPKNDLRQMRYYSSKLYQLHLASDAPDPVAGLPVSVVKDFSAFTEGLKDKRAVLAVQDEVYDLIEERYYRKFLCSELYFRYMSEKGPDTSAEARSRLSPAAVSLGEDDDEEDYCMVEEEEDVDQVYVQKLDLLKGCLRKKMSVLKGLRSRQSASPDIAQLQEEVEQLRSEIRELEFHIERTHEYISTIGKWHVQIPSYQKLVCCHLQCSSLPEGRTDKLARESYRIVPDRPRPNLGLSGQQVVMIGGHQEPMYNIIVHRRLSSDVDSSEDETYDGSVMAAGSSGWVVTRKLTDFEALHQGLKECGLLKHDLPKPSHGLFGSNKDKVFLDKSRQLLESYLQSLLRDEKLCSNEDLYHFLIPSPERLRQGSLRPVPQKKFFPTEVLKSVPFLGDFIESLIASAEEADEDDDLDGSRDRRDSIAEPLYSLIREVFELKGVFKWLRRQLMVFVQITFGRTMNKQIRETVKWLTCDGMIVYYVHTFRDSWWPNGKLAPNRPVRSDEEKASTKEAAKEKLLKNIPAVLQSFVGQQNSRRGVLKLFESLQDPRANKHIFYVLLEQVVYSLVPEVKSDKVRQRLQSNQSTQETQAEPECDTRKRPATTS